MGRAFLGPFGSCAELIGIKEGSRIISHGTLLDGAQASADAGGSASDVGGEAARVSLLLGEGTSGAAACGGGILLAPQGRGELGLALLQNLGEGRGAKGTTSVEGKVQERRGERSETGCVGASVRKEQARRSTHHSYTHQHHTWWFALLQECSRRGACHEELGTVNLGGARRPLTFSLPFHTLAGCPVRQTSRR